MSLDEPFDRWVAALEARHLADLTFSEVSRALRALSSAYVERRARLSEGAALAGAGKRAAFALFYAPMHYLIVREISRALPGATRLGPSLVDLGCGTGAAGAGWAVAGDHAPRVFGIDRHPWAVAEADRTYRAFGLRARTERGDVGAAPLSSPCAVLAAFTLNELPATTRDALLSRLITRRAPGDRLLVVEPLARSVAPWWDRWGEAVVSAGGRADEWRFMVPLPPLVTKLDRAAGLNHRELTARSLWLPSR
jgi:SAM-dependent methyltransferase